jgi:hypothetical protein
MNAFTINGGLLAQIARHLLALTTVPLLFALVACGDRRSDEERLCVSRQRLFAEVLELDNLNLLSQEAGDVASQLEEIEGALEEIKAAAQDIAADEVEELEDALLVAHAQVAELGDGSITVSNGGPLVLSLIDVVPHATRLVARFAAACDSRD